MPFRYDHRIRCFNPRAREGRDRFCQQDTAILRVSIHAPARGATHLTWQCVAGRVFQSTRPRGARQTKRRPRSALTSFNPRAREGRDGDRIGRLSEYHGFNPRAREGRDLKNKKLDKII